jgi:dihydrofolate reductase
MGKLIISTHVTLDGIIGPTVEWSTFDTEGERYKFDQLLAADAYVLGRKVYEGLSSYWPTATDDTGFADRVNSVPKHIASRTLQGPLSWNSSLITGDLTEAVTALKSQYRGNLISWGCGELGYELVTRGLVDEIHLWIQPVVWGEGERLFHGRRVRLERLTTTAFDAGATLVCYRPA